MNGWMGIVVKVRARFHAVSGFIHHFSFRRREFPLRDIPVDSESRAEKFRDMKSQNARIIVCQCNPISVEKNTFIKKE